ncbi:MAG TPA: tRNA pseudouridine(55) synthase TruB [Rudaea sp.]|nr:tRNA pseudouridine(55) synthase TruB [Rudaea sp.]
MTRSPESRISNPQSRALSGLLLLDKPVGLSSNQALKRAARLIGAKKSGHTGSLDPLASGLLPLCFGEATKIAGHLLGARKAYAAEVALGTTTSTDDAEGDVLATRPVPPFDDAALERALTSLRGRIVQVPPAYSAIKQGGVPLYKRARRGETVAPPPREVEIHRLEVIGREAERVRLYVECGSGTYVRSLARDLGERLGCGAHLAALRRLWVEPFREPAMVTLETLEGLRAQGDETALRRHLLPLEAALGTLPALHLDAAAARDLAQGKRLRQPGTAPAACCAALDPAGRLIALVEIGDAGAIRVLRGFNAAPEAPAS